MHSACGESTVFPYITEREGLHEISPEHDGGHSIDGEEEPDDKGITVKQYPTILQDGCQSGDRNGQLDKASDEPSNPVNSIVKTHHLHHLRKLHDSDESESVTTLTYTSIIKVGHRRFVCLVIHWWQGSFYSTISAKSS